MNYWGNCQSHTEDGCPVALGIVETVGKVGVNRRSAPVLDDKNIVGSWADDTLLMVWATTPATVPPGHWLWCQSVTGDVVGAWVHGTNIRSGRIVT